MKQTLLFLFCCAFSTGLLAQVEINNDVFPALGDTLRTATDAMPTGIVPGSSGADKTWDFSSLSADFSTETIYLDAAEGSAAADLPNADLYTDLGGAETYYQVTATQLRLLAGKGTDPTGFGVEALVKFTPPIIERCAPMNFGDVNSSESNASFAFGAEVIPDTLLDAFPIVPDSIRIRINQDRTDIVDAYGAITIPGGTYEVLREKRTQTRSTRVDVLLSFLGWQDVTDLIAGLVGVDAGLGDISTVNYLFFSDAEKEIIANITADETGAVVNSVTFKDNGLINATADVDLNQPRVNVYPNPATTETSFDFSNMEAGNYTLEMYNVLGILVWQKEVYLNGAQTEVVNLNNFQKGTYLYSVINKNGKTLTTKRLVVVK